MTKYILSIFILILGINIQAQGIEFEDMSWQKVKKKADSLDRPIFIDLYTSWCKPCQWMSERVFPNEKVGKYFNEHFLNYKMNAESAVGRILASKYSVKGYPTLLFVDKHGKELYRLMGYRAPEEFIREAQVVVQPGLIPKLELFERKFRSGIRDKRFLKDYVTLKKITLNQPVEEVFSAWYKQLSLIDFLDTNNMILLVKSIPNAHSKAYATALDFFDPKTLNEDKAIDSVTMDAMLFNLHLALTHSIDESIENNDLKLFNKTMKYSEELYIKENDSLDINFYRDVRQSKMDFYYHSKDAKEFASLAKAYAQDEIIVFGMQSRMLDKETGDTIQLSGYEYQFERSKDMDKSNALKLHYLSQRYYDLLPKDSEMALNWVKVAISLERNTDFYGLYALLLDANNQHKKAISELRKAMSRAKKEDKSMQELADVMTTIMQKKKP